MQMTRRELIRLAALGGALQAGGFAMAQDGYPKQPIRMVVPFTPGSATDVIGRTVGERLEKTLGQPVVVDNRPGAGGTLGAAMVAAANADGYTLLVHSAGHVANAALYPALKYDTQKDFTPVSMLASLPNVMVTSPANGFTSLQDLVQKVRAQPDRYTYASAGNGSATHINAEKFRIAVGIKATHVPYRGTPEAITGVIAGHVTWYFAPLVSALALIRDGKLQALAVGSATRSPLLPDTPTTVESGYPGSDYLFWVGMFLPARTPADIAQRLHAATVAALNSPEVRTRLEQLGAVTTPMSQEDFAALVAAEMKATAALIRQAGIRVEG
ncbi:MAG TPA: tripartite tricarboxylate transporter substrate binding protein [Burkholderiaceae bacterium]|jgi:tripartite-type tricarboxylate transporter receptor subunit TctC|nr:tripartite tricarboxylate transporter substrate binding protein [Burkholderiaceae bacterium]